MPKTKKIKQKIEEEIHSLESHLVPIKYRIPFYMGIFLGAIVAQVVIISFLTVISV